MKATGFEDLPTVEKVLGRRSHGDESGSMVYQRVQLLNYERSSTFVKNNHQPSQYTNDIQDCLHERVKNQSTDLLTHAITTHGWEKSESTAFG